MNGTRYQRNSNGYTHVFEVNQVNGGVVEVIHAFHDLEKQNGGRKTGEIIHSEAMEDDLNETPVTTPVFSSYTGTISLAETVFVFIRLIRDLENKMADLENEAISYIS